MADKKITELTELTTLADVDLFVVVDDPAGTPITKKILARNVFGNGASFTTNATFAGATVLRSTLTANVSAESATANTLIAADFLVNATSTSANSHNQFAMRATSKLAAAESKVALEHAAAKLVLDVGPATNVVSNTSVLRLVVANTGARVSNVQSFISFGDAAANSTTAQTKYLFDIGQNGSVSANLTSNTNATTLFSTSATGAATHKLRVRINGDDYFLLVANTAT